MLLKGHFQRRPTNGSSGDDRKIFTAKIASNAPTPVLPVAAVFANDRQTGMT
jgi:hypothetical protein